MSRRTLGHVVRFAVAATLIAWLTWSGRFDWRAFAAVEAGWLLAALVGCRLAATMVPLLRWSWLLRARGVPMGTAAALHCGFIGQFAGLALPASIGMDGTRLWYATRRYPGRGAEVVSSLVVDRAVGMTALLTMAVAGGLLFLPPAFAAAVLGASVLLAGTAAAAWAFLRLWRRIRLPWRLPQQVVEGLAAYRGHRGTLAAAFALSCVGHAIGLAALWLSFGVLGAAPPAPAVAGAGPLVSLARELPLAPLGIGVTETAAAFAFGALGVDGGAEAIMLVRLVFVAIALGGGVAFLWPAARGARCDSAN
ncbi:MAG: lysylphosphatidylglycerol synthase transmembrane domain-containing protein [Rhodospirillaceae bacterium]